MRLETLSAPFKSSDIDFIAAGYLDTELLLTEGRTISIKDLSADLSKFIEVTKHLRNIMNVRRAADSKQTGRRPGPQNFPTLPRLVYMLEHRARAANGGFSINKRDYTGSLLDALDLLRNDFMRREETKWLAALLPLPDQHRQIISTYSRSICAARSTISSEGQNRPSQI
jgi:hypothetical protein